MAVIDTMKAATNAVLGAKPREGGAIISDMNALVPAFRVRVERVVADMRAEGWDPRVFETLRSTERAMKLAAKGTGVVQSMHCYGIAADIISASKLWNASPGFWLSLRRNAEKHGLVSGAAWRRHDLPHVQGVPVDKQWLIKQSTPEEIARIIARHLPL